MRNLSEQELVVLAQEGNDRATSILLENLRVTLLKNMIRKFNNMPIQTIEDCVQTSLMKVFMNIKNYNPSFSFKTWVFRICTNTVIDEKRRSSKRMYTESANSFSLDHSVQNSDSDEMPTLGELLPSTMLNPADSLENDEKGEFAINIIANCKVSDSIKEVVEMRYIDELSYDEIVDKTGNPLGTVKSWLNRFRTVAEANTPNKSLMAVS